MLLNAIPNMFCVLWMGKKSYTDDSMFPLGVATFNYVYLKACHVLYIHRHTADAVDIYCLPLSPLMFFFVVAGNPRVQISSMLKVVVQ